MKRTIGALPTTRLKLPSARLWASSASASRVMSKKAMAMWVIAPPASSIGLAKART